MPTSSEMSETLVLAPLNLYIADDRDSALALPPDNFARRIKAALGEATDFLEVTNPDEADVILFNQKWQSRNWHNQVELLRCPFLGQYSAKVLTISHDDVATIFLPGLYTSLTPRNRWSNWSVPCGYKQEYRTLSKEPLPNSPGQRKWLFTFRGAEVSHPVRRRICRTYKGPSREFNVVSVNTKFHSHTESEFHTYVSEMLDSHFVLAPRGFSPTTYRLFEAMQYGRCPVIVSDEWQPIPGIDWDSCSIRIREDDVGSLLDILNARKAYSVDLGREARRIWEMFFSDGNRERNMLLELMRIHTSCTLKRDLDSLERLWNSSRFKRAHGWSIKQRVARKAAALRAQICQ